MKFNYSRLLLKANKKRRARDHAGKNNSVIVEEKFVLVEKEEQGMLV